MSQIALKQAFFTKQKHCPTQLFVLHHYSEAKTRDFIEIVSILASNLQNATFHRKGLVNAKMSQIGLKQAFFTKQNHCPTQLLGLHHYSGVKTRDFIEIVSILASNSQNAAFHRKGLVNAKMSQIALKQAFFTKQKHCPTQLFVLHHYAEAKTRDFIEIVSILASN